MWSVTTDIGLFEKPFLVMTSMLGTCQTPMWVVARLVCKTVILVALDVKPHDQATETTISVLRLFVSVCADTGRRQGEDKKKYKLVYLWLYHPQLIGVCLKYSWWQGNILSITADMLSTTNEELQLLTSSWCISASRLLRKSYFIRHWGRESSSALITVCVIWEYLECLKYSQHPISGILFCFSMDHV